MTTEPELLRILNTLPGMIAFWDGDCRNQFANDAYVDWFEVPPVELRGMRMQDLLGMEAFEIIGLHVEAALAGCPQLFEWTLADSGGHTRDVEVVYVPNVVDGAPTGFLSIIHDISLRVRAEQHVTLLREQRRIAVDLHDLVIQRLFAAGLDLVASRKQDAEHSALRVDSAAAAIDEAIVELRRAIHSLREPPAEPSAQGLAGRTSDKLPRVLGFVPTMNYTGALESVPEEVLQDVLAALNEVLTNLELHVGAAQLDITLTCGETEVVLRVADDGDGLKPVDRSRALWRMRKRAERHGGSLRFVENQPRGTVLEWVTPVPAEPTTPPA